MYQQAIFPSISASTSSVSSPIVAIGSSNSLPGWQRTGRLSLSWRCSSSLEVLWFPRCYKLRGQQAGYAIAGGALSAAQMGHRGAHHHPALLPDQPLDPQDSLGQPSVVKNNTWLAGTCVGRSKNPGVGERTTAHAPREESARLSWKHLAYCA